MTWSEALKAHDDLHWMHHALMLAERGERDYDEIPVGAVIIDGEGAIIGEGFNRSITDNDPTAHAEIVALRAAGQRLQNYRLPGCTMYITLEPCTMCAMALIHARLKRVVFGAYDPNAGSVFDVLGDPRHNHRVEITGGILADETGQRLREYFRRKRGRVNAEPVFPAC